MIKFEIPRFFNLKMPKYRFGDSEPIMAVKFFPPFVKEELYDLVKEDKKSKEFADLFNRFVLITFFGASSVCVGIILFMGSFSYFTARFSKTFLVPTFFLLALTIISNFMACRNFKLMADAFSKFFNEKRRKDDIFIHYEVNENGVFKRRPRKKQ
jgi:hypothetical protein